MADEPLTIPPSRDLLVSANRNLRSRVAEIEEAADELVVIVETYWPNAQPPRSIQAAIRRFRAVEKGKGADHA